jgi:hypothetical protein
MVAPDLTGGPDDLAPVLRVAVDHGEVADYQPAVVLDQVDHAPTSLPACPIAALTGPAWSDALELPQVS